jgi:hypothetical protein
VCAGDDEAGCQCSHADTNSAHCDLSPVSPEVFAAS